MADNAFQRASRFLDYNSTAKWSALVASVVAGILYLGFLLLLALFVDQLVHEGVITSFRGLPGPLQKSHLQDVQTPLENAQEKLSTLGLDPNIKLPNSQLTLAQVAGMEEKDLQPREKDIRREILWRRHVYDYLQANVSEEAAEHYQKNLSEMTNDVGTLVALDLDVPNCGFLSQVIRKEHRLEGGLVAFVAWMIPWLWAGGIFYYLLVFLIAGVILAIIRGLVMFFNHYLAAVATTDAVTRLRRAIYHHTYRLGALAFRAGGPSEAVGISTRRLESIHEGLFVYLTVNLREPIKFGLLFLLALLIHIWLAISFLLISLLVWLVGGQISVYFHGRSNRATQRAAEQLGLVQESIMMMRLVKVYLMEPFNQARVERQLARYSKAQIRNFLGEAIYRPMMIFLGIVACLVMLFITGMVVHYGHLSVTGAIILATALVSMYLPLQKWLEHRRTLLKAVESADVLFDFLDQSGSVGQSLEAEFLEPLSKNLEFEGVSLREKGSGKQLLKNVNLTVRAGQRVAIVGQEDTEKYALVYLIPRFMDPTGGEIRIDGKNLRWTTLDSLREQIAVVLQHNLVFNDTVANNIGCGDKSFTLPQLIDVAKLAHAHQFIQKLPRGYETVIGEMGHILSISQQFRIALARAILRDPALLIIEEPSVPLDEDVKDLLDDTMARVLPGRTVIFLPHRLSTIRHCDRVFVLHNGEITASGDHRELLKTNEYYRHLQYLEFNEFASETSGDGEESEAFYAKKF